MTQREIEKLRDDIETLPQEKHKEVMLLLHQHGVKFSFNRNGCFLNLGIVSNDVLIALKDYLNNEFDAIDSTTTAATTSAAKI
jgi:hypothetical protein